jgi:glycosyltransferase involved in cell wall biosynthesis
MYKGSRIAVVVPAFNEAGKIAATLRSIPGFVDHVIMVDDASVDATFRIAGKSQRRGLQLVRHDRNQGVGAAIGTGYLAALELGAEVVAVMAGDSQMDPADLANVIDPVVTKRADYAKGNRFGWPGVYRTMPWSRILGNFILSHLTRVASGYRELFDSQCGYTATNRRALGVILRGPMFPRYGYPNHILTRLAASGARVVDVPVRPVYGPAWRSGIRIRKVIWPLLYLLARGSTERLLRRVGVLRPRSLETYESPP